MSYFFQNHVPVIDVVTQFANPDDIVSLLLSTKDYTKYLYDTGFWYRIYQEHYGEEYKGTDPRSALVARYKGNQTRLKDINPSFEPYFTLAWFDAGIPKDFTVYTSETYFDPYDLSDIKGLSQSDQKRLIEDNGSFPILLGDDEDGYEYIGDMQNVSPRTLIDMIDYMNDTFQDFWDEHKMTDKYLSYDLESIIESEPYEELSPCLEDFLIELYEQIQSSEILEELERIMLESRKNNQ